MSSSPSIPEDEVREKRIGELIRELSELIGHEYVGGPWDGKRHGVVIDNLPVGVRLGLTNENNVELGYYSPQYVGDDLDNPAPLVWHPAENKS